MADIKDFPPLQDALRVGLPQLLNGQTVLVGFPTRVPVLLAGITSGTSIPDDLAAKAVAGFVRPTVIDNIDDGVTQTAVVDVEFFCTRYDRGMAVAERIRGILLNERRVGGVVLDRRTTSGPKEVRWDQNNTVRRFLSTGRISTRR
jgi:hypothetical protein